MEVITRLLLLSDGVVGVAFCARQPCIGAFLLLGIVLAGGTRAPTELHILAKALHRGSLHTVARHLRVALTTLQRLRIQQAEHRDFRTGLRLEDAPSLAALEGTQGCLTGISVLGLVRLVLLHPLLAIRRGS